MAVNTFYTADRAAWRAWLTEHFETEKEIWFVFPMKESDETSLSYNGAVGEAHHFGWIEHDPAHRFAAPRTAFHAEEPGQTDRIHAQISNVSSGLMNEDCYSL